MSGHSGNQENEMANRVAGAYSRTLLDTTGQSQRNSTFTMAKRRLREKMRSRLLGVENPVPAGLTTHPMVYLQRMMKTSSAPASHILINMGKQKQTKTRRVLRPNTHPGPPRMSIVPGKEATGIEHLFWGDCTHFREEQNELITSLSEEPRASKTGRNQRGTKFDV